MEEPLVRKDVAEPRSELFTLDVQTLGAKRSLQDICKDNHDKLLLNLGETLLYFKHDRMMWEVMQEGEAKFMHLHTTAQEFAAFFINLFGFTYTMFKSKLVFVEFEDLRAIYRVLKKIDQEEPKTLAKNNRFCSWMGAESRKDNRLLAEMEAIMKVRSLVLIKECREQKKTRVERVSKLFEDTLEKAANSALFGVPYTSIRGYNVLQDKVLRNENVYSYSDRVTVFDAEKVIVDIMEEVLFLSVSPQLSKLIVQGQQTCEADYRRVLQEVNEQAKQGTHVDKVYNYPIFELHKYWEDDIDANVKTQMDVFAESVSSGEFWNNHLGATIYLDSTKGLPRFYIHKTMMSETDELKLGEVVEHVDQNTKGNDGRYYPDALAPEVPYTRDEAIAYCQVSLFRVCMDYFIFVPKGRIGFYTMYE